MLEPAKTGREVWNVSLSSLVITAEHVMKAIAHALSHASWQHNASVGTMRAVGLQEELPGRRLQQSGT